MESGRFVRERKRNSSSNSAGRTDLKTQQSRFRLFM